MAIEGVVSVPGQPITGATQQVEIQVRKIYCVDKATPVLPVNVVDAARSEVEIEKALEAGEQLVRVNQDIRLNYIVLDMRTPANQGIFHIQCQVENIFRHFLLSEGFVGIHTPKLIAGSNEGGSAVFRLDYKGTPACLARSPQLHKQMSICGDFGHYLHKTLRLTFEEGVQMLKEKQSSSLHGKRTLVGVLPFKGGFTAYADSRATLVHLITKVEEFVDEHDKFTTISSKSNIFYLKCVSAYLANCLADSLTDDVNRLERDPDADFVDIFTVEGLIRSELTNFVKTGPASLRDLGVGGIFIGWAPDKSYRAFDVIATKSVSIVWLSTDMRTDIDVVLQHF